MIVRAKLYVYRVNTLISLTVLALLVTAISAGAATITIRVGYPQLQRRTGASLGDSRSQNRPPIRD